MSLFFFELASAFLHFRENDGGLFVVLSTALFVGKSTAYLS